MTRGGGDLSTLVEMTREESRNLCPGNLIFLSLQRKLHFDLSFSDENTTLTLENLVISNKSCNFAAQR